MSRILVAERVAQAGLDILAATHETAVRLNLPRPELLAAVAEHGGWDALVVRSQTRVDAELLAAAAPRLSVVAVASVGTDRVDLAAAARAGVTVVNAPTGSTIAAAEHTMALMLALLRKIPSADASVRRGEWERARYVGAELQHRTLGIIGLGKIGKAVARRAAAFEMRVIAHDPWLTPEQAAGHATRLVGFLELLNSADVVTVHVTLTPETRGLIGKTQIAAMKPGTVLVNVARGGLVDEEALASALHSGHLGGAAIDVFTTEPMAPDNPLRGAPNTILTPHLGASTTEAQERAGVEMAERLLEALSNQGPTLPEGHRPIIRR
jgi:D-3-phosphoglycerate dehydrogenase